MSAYDYLQPAQWTGTGLARSPLVDVSVVSDCCRTYYMYMCMMTLIGPLSAAMPCLTIIHIYSSTDGLLQVCHGRADV